MTTVYLLQADHQSVPSRVIKIFAGKTAADKEAADLVNMMLSETEEDCVDEDIIELIGPKPEPCDHTNWPERMAWLTVVHEEECWCDVQEMQIIGRSFRVEINWNDDQPEEGTYSCEIEAMDEWEAETAVRAEMRDHDNHKRQFSTYGRLISCEEF